MKAGSCLFAATMVGAGLLSGAPGATAQEEFPEMNLKYALFVPSTLPQSQTYIWWADQIRERSGGKINIEFFWSESLGKATELLELVGSGAVDIAAPAPAYYPSKLSLTNVTQLPRVFPTNSAAQLLAEDLEGIEGIQEENERNNIVPLMWTSVPTYHLLCNSEIRTMADFAGKKLRAYGQYVPRMWEAIGAAAVTTTSPEIYEGLQRGALDCSYLSNDFAYSIDLHDVAKYYIDINFGAIGGYVAYTNADKYAAWPDNVKMLFEEVGIEAAARDREAIREVADEALQKMLDEGLTRVEFEEMDKLDAVIPDFLDVWVDAMDERGLRPAAQEVAVAARKRVEEAASN